MTDDGTPDHVDVIVSQWRRERPDVDTSPLSVIGRIHRLAVTLDRELRLVFDQANLGSGEFDILATLRRSGSPFELSPGALMAQTMISSGAVTKRVDRLAKAGLVERSVSPTDARARRIQLTARGLQVTDEVFAKHMANEHRLLRGLTVEQRADLASLLRTLGQSLHDETEPAAAAGTT